MKKIKISESLKTYKFEAAAERAAERVFENLPWSEKARYLIARNKAGKWFVTFFVTNPDHVAYTLGTGHLVIV